MKALKNWNGIWVWLYHESQVGPCTDCNGAGELTIRHPSGDPQLERNVVCSDCGGEGDRVYEEPYEVSDSAEPRSSGSR